MATKVSKEEKPGAEAPPEATPQAPVWLSSLRRGPQRVPPRICIYGGHGIGKSTLAAAFPSPIFISTEDGLDSLDVVSFPKATELSHVVESIKTLIREEHEFRTVVIDSVDWLVEPLISNSVNQKYDEKQQAYGKGQVYVADELREIFQGLDRLRERRGMNVVLIAHAAVVKFEDPRTDPYDRYQPKLPKSCNAILQEWVDVLAFATFKVIIKKSEAKGFDTAKVRGTTNGDRLLYLVENPAFAAKNRYKCPEEIEMSYSALQQHIPALAGND